MDAIHYANYRQVEKKYNELANDDMKWFFSSFNTLIPKPKRSKITWDITIAYLFMKIEQAQRMALYAALVKEYKVDKELAVKFLDNLPLRRDDFLKIYEILMKEKLCNRTIEIGKNAAKVRDKIMHGKGLVHGRGILFGEKVKTHEKRDAVVFVFEYAKLFNEQTQGIFGFEPFGRMQGFAGGTITEGWDKSIEKLEELEIPLPTKNTTIHEFLKKKGIENQNHAQ